MPVWTHYFAHFVVAVIATISFGITFQMPRRHYLACGLTGAVGWMVYIFGVELFALSPAIATLVATLPLTGCARFFAIRHKAPVTIFLLPGIFPLVPGAGIYYTAYYFLQGEQELFASKGGETFKVALALALGIAFGAVELFDVSFALGAFFAGMVMRESKYAHRAAVESLPLRDAFSVIFFVGVGMMFNPMVIVEHPWHLLCVLLLILFINPIIAALLVMLFRYPLHTALTLGACLGQIGEFSFILASLGKSMGIVSDEGMNLVLATAILTIALNPIAFATLPKVAEFLKKRSKLARISAARPDPQSLMPDEIEKKKITGHIVIVGYGDVGCKLTAALQKDEIPTVIVDKDDSLVAQLRKNGYTAIQGDAIDPSVLLQAHVQNAAVIVLTIRDEILERKVVETAKLINQGIKVILRAATDQEANHFRADNLGTVVQASVILSQEMDKLVRQAILKGDSPVDEEIAVNSDVNPAPPAQHPEVNP